MSKGKLGVIGRFMGVFSFEPAIKKIIMEVRFKKLHAKAPADYKKTF